MTDTTAQSLVTFFSVVFGFYVASIALLYNSSYIKNLHKRIDEKARARYIHILRDYLRFSGRYSIFSITLIIAFTTCTTKDASGVLSIAPFVLPFMDWPLDLNLLLTSALLGISAANIICMLLLLHAIINGMVEEARE